MKTTFTLIITGLFLFLVSCCPKNKCSQYIVIDFNNFEAKDADTVQLIMYLSGSNFTAVFDSSVKYDAFPNFTLAGVPTYDYKIKLPSTGQQFLISNFKLKTVPACDNSLFCHATTQMLDSYTLNGTSYSGQSIELYK